MIEVTPRLVFLVLFISGLAYFLYRDREKIQRRSILFYRRTKNGVEEIDSIQKRLPRFWKAYGWGAAISGVLSMVLAALYIGRQYIDVFQSGSIEKSGLSAVLPGLVSEASFQPGVSLIPVEYWLIGIGVVMTVHELSHGIVARSEGFEINSVGWIVLGIFPGAFVEPKGEKMLPAGEGEEEELQEDEDDEENSSSGMWDQGTLSSRIKVLGAGSFANYLTAGIFLLLASTLVGAVTHPGQIVYTAQEDYPAAEAGLTNGTLHSYNGQPINSVPQLVNATEGLQPGDQVTLNTSEGVYTFEAGSRNVTPSIGIPGIIQIPTGPERTEGHVGILFGQTTQLDEPYQPYSGFLNWLISMFQTVGILNIGIGLVNMLPIKPLDGGQILGGVIDKYAGGNATKAFNYISGIGMLALILTILLSVGSAL